MRFLCLHGRGTNAEIFRQQTARVREQIGPQHEFVFVDGIVPAKAMNGLTRDNLVPGNQYGKEYKGFWPLESGDEEQFRQLYHNLVSYLTLNGPFEGLMGFSEGASVAATVMVEEAQRRQHEQHVPHVPIKCGIFFCGLPPLQLGEVGSPVGTIRLLDSELDGTLLSVPTAHIWSKDGHISRGMGQALLELSAKGMREEVVHGLGHDVPGARSDEGVRETVLVMERAIERARS